MLRAVTALLVFQCLGEILAQALRLPVPGPVLGMAALLAWLRLRPGAVDRLRDGAQALLSHLSLLFVPAGVGVMLHGRRLVDEGVAIGVALVASTALAIIVTALTVDAVRRWQDRRAARAGADS